MPIFKNKISSVNPATILLLVGLILGVLFCTFIPYGVGYDEEQHLIRILDISGLHLIPNRPVSQGNYTFSAFYSLSYQNQYFLYPEHNQFDVADFSVRPDWKSMSPGITTSTYFPLAFLPQAFVAGFAWRVFDFPILPTVIVMRFIGLLIYLFACLLAMRMLPVGKWIFLVLALAPTALFQAATLNDDGFTNAACFLFLALLLKLAGQKNQPVTQADSWKVFTVTLLLGIAKPGTIILLPLLLLLIKHKFESKKGVATILSGILLSVIISVGWVSLAVLHNTTKNGSTLFGQMVLVLNNLGDFIPMYLKGVQLTLNIYYHQLVATYAYYTDIVPRPVYWLFPVALISAYFSEFKDTSLLIRDRLITFLVSLLGMGVIGSFIFVINYVPGHQGIGSEGRYFVMLVPLFFIAWAGLFKPNQKFKTVASIVTMSMLVVTLGLFTFGFFKAFYPNCAPAVGSDHSCKLPIYFNLDLNNPPFIKLSSTTTIEQSFKTHCSNISDIELKFGKITADSGGILQLSLLNSNDQLLQTSEIPVRNINAKGQTALIFPTTPINMNNVYHFQLILLDPSPLDATVELMARKGDYYTNGKLLVNGSQSNIADDLYFQYTCTD